MNVITRTAASMLLLLLALTAPVIAQQKRPTQKPQPKATAAPAPAPTFETLVPADSYTFYGEVRGAGQLIRSSAVNDLLEPVLKLSAPPKEFRTVVKWLDAHAEEVMTSRLLVAIGPTVNAKQAPQSLIAIEFATAEEATKFAGTLNEFLPTIMPPPAPEPSPKQAEGANANEKPKPTAPPEPGFHLQRMGSLVVITPRPWTMKQLKPAGSKLLAEDANFRAARNRFSSEPIFVYVNTKAMEREDEERQKRSEEQNRLAEEQLKQMQEAAKADEKQPAEPDEPQFLPEKDVELDATAKLGIGPSTEGGKEALGPELFSMLLSGLGASFFSGESHMPEGIGLALAFEGDSFDLRVLLVSQSSARNDALPFMPMLITGPALSPEAPNIFPADTELLLTMSLDLPQIYATMSKPQPKQSITTSHGMMVNTKEVEPVSPFAAIEERLKIKLKDDLLPLLGSEIALRLPTESANMMGIPGILPATPIATSGDSAASVVIGTTRSATEQPQSTNAAPVLAIAVKDKEGLRALMPKLIDNFGFKGASSLMQTERREDTELISFANVFAYAFVGNFIVLSSDATSTRYVVDSYLKHETLSSDIQFKNSTRWQPRPLHGQLYISPVLMEGYKKWANQPSTQVSDQVRAFLTRASTVAQPITYSLSNEGSGPLHEVHIPRNLILMAVAGISGNINPP
ncbi:MAG TPA: MAP7 domain-containing protein, partial [Pyrinomonadaceae bacterium]|nr:MAP7 domain-containing protein [Pyrinomonadaceae bacterium]